MQNQSQLTRQTITLKGSTKIVTEFFGYAVNSVLYQRGIYGPETFTPVKKYGLQLMVTTDPGLTKYLSSVLKQISEWLIEGRLQKLVLVICKLDGGETIERWAFDVQTDQECVSEGKTHEKSEEEIQREIQAVVRQITASITFLPLLNDVCTFDLLCYTDKDSDVPLQWEESEAKYIANQAEVKLRSFSTSVHTVEPMVAYKAEEDEFSLL